MSYKSLNEVQEVISLGKPLGLINMFLESHLQGVEHAKWAEGKDLEETITVIVGQDVDGNDITEERLVNVYAPVVVDPQAFLATYKPYLRTKRDKMIVTVSTGKTFDADIMARLNIADAIDLGEIMNITTTQWKLADNSIVEVTIGELREAKFMALQEFGRLSGVV